MLSDRSPPTPTQLLRAAAELRRRCASWRDEPAAGAYADDLERVAAWLDEQAPHPDRPSLHVPQRPYGRLELIR